VAENRSANAPGITERAATRVAAATSAFISDLRIFVKGGQPNST
jgi:hypothetical protein